MGYIEDLRAIVGHRGFENHKRIISDFLKDHFHKMK